MSTISASTKRVLVLAGVGKGGGLGATIARHFAKEGWGIALLSRQNEALHQLADEINRVGGQAIAFPLVSYSHEDIASTWASIRDKFSGPSYSIRAAVFNAHQPVSKPFLEITPEEIQRSLDVSVAAAFAFSREAILTFKDNDIEEPVGKRGALIFSGATASLRGNVRTSLFAASKFGARALSQSLNKAFGKDNIHVSHVIIDGVISKDSPPQTSGQQNSESETDANTRLNPTDIADAFLYLTNQGRSSWTWELDLRPAHEKW